MLSLYELSSPLVISLSYVIMGDDIQVDGSKVETIKSQPVPASTT